MRATAPQARALPADVETTGSIYPFVRTFPNPHAKTARDARPLLSRWALSTLLVLIGLGGGVELLTLWWLQTPPARVQNLSEELIMGAQLTGLIGGYLLLIEVALMARLPWLEHRIGSWLASLHRYLGSYLMLLLTLHVLLVLAGYSLSLHDPPDAVFTSAFSKGQSAMASDPSSMASVSRYGDATEPLSRWSRPMTRGALTAPDATSSLKATPARSRSP